MYSSRLLFKVAPPQRIEQISIPNGPNPGPTVSLAAKLACLRVGFHRFADVLTLYFFFFKFTRYNRCVCIFVARAFFGNTRVPNV